MTGPLVSESLARLSTGLSRRDARDVGQLLQELASRVRESPAAIAAYAKISPTDIERACSSSSLSSTLKSFFEFLGARDSSQAFGSLSAALSNLTQSLEGTWQLPLLGLFCRFLTETAISIDVEMAKKKQKTSYRSQAQNQLARLLSVIIMERGPGASALKYALLSVGTTALKLCFQMQEFHLTPKMMAQIESQLDRKMDLSEFPRAHQVAYKYYAGRVHMYRHEFAAADETLTFAFKHCPMAYLKNKRLIGCYLIAARMVRGCLPSRALLQGIQLEPHYGPLVSALKTGNITAFEERLMERCEFFRSKSLFVILKEKCQLVMFRNLIFRAARILGESSRNQVPLCALQTACAMAVPDLSVGEVESLVVSLIDQGYIRGYLLHGRQLLVLAKNQAFPRPYSVADLSK